VLLTVVWALSAAAQDDSVLLHDGSRVDAVRIDSYDVFTLRYSKGGNTTVAADQVAKITLGKFSDVYRRGLADPSLMLTLAREQLAAKNTLMAQMGFLHAAARLFDAGEPAKATAVFEEVQKAIPAAAVLPELYRRKFEYYSSLGAGSLRDAAQVGKQYRSDAVSGSWPKGFLAEAELFLVLAEPDAVDFQGKLRAVVARSDAAPLIGNRARIELANCLRRGKDFEAARRIYDEVQNRDGVDANSRAAALLGLGLLLLDEAKTADTAVFKQALLLFLRVRLETRDARAALHAEALYRAIVTADKWRGPEYTLIIGRCRRLLLDEFPSTEWAKLAKDGF
jgi:tetratricopeptide (TPR) repeat protein